MYLVWRVCNLDLEEIPPLLELVHSFLKFPQHPLLLGPGLGAMSQVLGLLLQLLEMMQSSWNHQEEA